MKFLNEKDVLYVFSVYPNWQDTINCTRRVELQIDYNICDNVKSIIYNQIKVQLGNNFHQNKLYNPLYGRIFIKNK